MSKARCPPRAPILCKVARSPALSGDQGQTVQTNVGTLTNPTAFWSTHSGFRMPELAWQESFDAGHIVALAGVINQGNYIDANVYANSGRGQFINSALIDSMVLPLPAYGYGVNLQWQPSYDWYALLGYSVGSANAAEQPKTNFSWETWSVEWEVGHAPGDVLGLGPGVYRIQPFLARSGGDVQGGPGRQPSAAAWPRLAVRLVRALRLRRLSGVERRQGPGWHRAQYAGARQICRMGPPVEQRRASSGASRPQRRRRCTTTTSTYSRRSTRCN